MSNPTNGLEQAAETHLRLLKTAREQMDRSDRIFVPLAFTYGLTVDEIADTSGLTVERVRAIIGGA